MATSKKTAAPKTTLAAAGITPKMLGKSAPKSSKSATPAILAKAGKQFGADAAGVPGSKKPTKAPKAKPAVDLRGDVGKAALLKPKRTVAQPAGGLSALPEHTYHDAASLAHVLGTFPRGSTVDLMDDHIAVYNLRGRAIANVRKGDKPKTSRANKL